MKNNYRAINYIDKFSCLADKCPDTCCAGWKIEIDEKSLEKYNNVRSDYSHVLRERIDADECVFRQKENGDCSFLCENKLCDMYIALGEDSLCDTCRLYPRHIEEFEDAYEMNLSVSCPEAARILLEQDGPIAMLDTGKYEVASNSEDEETGDKKADNKKTENEENDENFNSELYDLLIETRESLIEIVRNRSVSYSTRAAQIVKAASKLQDRLDSLDVIETDADSLKEDSEDLFYLIKDAFDCLKELEYLKDSREAQLNKAENILYLEGNEYWRKLHAEFEKYCAENALKLEVKKEQITAYYLYSYFCGAVYDDYVFAKAFGAVMHTALINELWIAKWIQNNKRICNEDMVTVLYEYARELENSNPNLIHMDEMMDDLKIDADMIFLH